MSPQFPFQLNEITLGYSCEYPVLQAHSSLQHFRKHIEINVIDDEEYEKKEIFYVVLGEPIVVKNEDDDSGAGTDIGYDAEKERLEELGKPRLGRYCCTSVANAFQHEKTQLGHKNNKMVFKNQWVLKKQLNYFFLSSLL